RRRHTRFSRDWSSDVCSSDLRFPACCPAPAAGTTTPTATSGCSAAPSDSFPVKAAAPLDYRELARRRLPHFLFEYMDGGAFDEATLARNRADLAAIALRQRVLRDVSGLNLSTRLFGQR